MTKPRVILCDNYTPGKYRTLCLDNNWGLEIQAYVLPDRSVDFQAIKAIFEGIQLRALRAPHFDLCPGTVDSMIRGVTDYRLNTMNKIAVGLECQHIICHTGFVPHVHDADIWLKNTAEFWKGFLSKNKGEVSYHLKNVLEDVPDLITEVIALAENARLKIDLDIANLLCHSRVSAVDWIKMLGPNIGYVHFPGCAAERYGSNIISGESVSLNDICSALGEFSPLALWAFDVGDDDESQALIDWLSENHLE